MSSDGSESSGLLNKAVPLGLYAVLVVLGFYMLMTNGPPLVLAMLAVIAATLTYLFLAKPLRQGPEDGASLLSPEMSSDLTQTIEIGARMDQIVADVEQLKRSAGGVNVDAIKRQVGGRIEQLAAEIQEVKQDACAIDTADITQAINTRFEQVMAEIEDLKQSGGSVDVSELRRELDTRLAQIAGDIEDVRQVGGGIDTQDIQREMRAHVGEIMAEIEDLRARGGGVDVESIKEQLATLQVYQTSAALSEKDRIDRISTKLNALQRIPDEVVRLKENQRLSETERHKITTAAKDLEEHLTTLQARLDETASVDRVQGWMSELREDMESIENHLKGFAQASDLKALSDELAPQLHSLQKLVIELQDPTKIKELVADIEKIKERMPTLAAANDVEMLAEHVKQQVRELNGIIDETDQTEAVQQLRTKLAEEISGLRQELEKTATADEMEEAADAVKAQMAEISARLDGVTAKELEERFANLRNEIRKVRESLSAVPKTQDVHKLLSEVRAEAAEQGQEVADGFTAAAEAREALSGEMSELRENLASLREKSQEIATLRTRLDEAATVEHVKEWLGELRENVAAVENRLEESAAAEDLKALKEELTPQIRVLQKAVGEMKDPKKLDDVAVEVESIKEQLAEFAGTGDLDDFAKDIEQQMEELAKTVRETDQTHAVRELRAKTDQGLEEIRGRLAGMSKRAEVEEATASIKGQLAELSARLEGITAEELEGRLDSLSIGIGALKEELSLAPKSEEIEALQRAVAERKDTTKLDGLVAQVDVLNARAGAFASSSEIEVVKENLKRQIAELRNALEGANPTEAIEKFQARVNEELEAVKNQLQATARQADVQEVADSIRGQVTDLASRLDRFTTEELGERLDGIMGEVDSLKEALEAAVTSDEVHKLAEKVEAETSAVTAKVKDLAAEESQARLSELRAEIDQLRESLSAAVTRGDVQELMEDMREEVGAQLQKLERTLAAESGARNEMSGDIEKLQEKLHEVSEAASEIVTIQSRFDHTVSGERVQNWIADIREDVDGLKDRLQDMASVGEVKAVSEELTPQVEALQQALDEVKESTHLDDLVAELDGIKEQLAVFAASSEVESTAEEVRQQIAELRNILDETDQAQAVIDLQTNVRRELDDMQKLLANPPAAEDVEKATEDLRAQMADLSSRVDRLAGEGIEERMSAVTEEVAALRNKISSAANRDDVEELMEHIRSQTTASEEVPADIQDLRQKVSELSHVSTEISLLWERLAELKWGIKPDEEAEVAGTRELEQMLAGHRRELDALSVRLDGLSAETSEELLAELRSEIETLKEVASAAPASETAAEDVSQLVDDVRAEVAERLQSVEDALSSESDAHEELEGEISALRDKLDKVSKPAAIEIDLGNQSFDRARKWVDELRGDVENLQAKLEDAALHSDLDGLGQELTSRMEALHETMKQLEAQSLPENFRAEIDTIKAQIEEISLRPAGPAAEELDQRLQELEDDLRAEHEAKEEVSRSVAELRDKIEDAGEAAREIASVRQRIEEAASVDKVQEWIGELHTGLNALEKKLADTATAANIKALREELKPHVEALEQTIEELKDPARLDRLTEEIASIKEQLSAFVSASEIEAVSADMRQQVDELKATLSDVDVQQAIEELRAQFTEKLDALTPQVEARASADDITKVAAELREQVAEVTSRVDELAEEELRPRIFEINDEIKALKEAVSSATETEEAKGLLEQVRAEVSEQLSAIQDALSTESDAREQLSEGVAAIEEKLARVSDATAEIDQLWERLAEVKWGLTPAEPAETTEPPRGMDQMLDTMRGEIAGMAARLDGLDMDDAQRQLSELRNEIQALKDVASPVPTDDAPSGPSRQVSPIIEVPAPPPSEPGSELSGAITEVTRLKDFEAGKPPAVPPIDAGPETEAMVPLSEAEITGAKLLHISNPAVQSVMASYSHVVASMDRVLNAVRENREDNELRETWQAACELTAAMAENSRVLVSLTSRPYEDGVKMIANHGVNVFLLALRVSETASMSEDERAALGGAALFHDIGVMRLPQQAFGAQASPESQAEQRKYPEYSAQLLQELGDELLCTLVLQTHEREDGAGFPKGLTGPQIHPLAKLLHVADVFDALIHVQEQSPPLPFEAMKMLQNEVGTSLNAEAFGLFREAIGPFPVGTIVELNTRERAKVIDVKARETLRPAVAVLTDAHGEHLPESRFLDLQQSAGFFMARALVDADLQERARDIF